MTQSACAPLPKDVTKLSTNVATSLLSWVSTINPSLPTLYGIQISIGSDCTTSINPIFP